MSVFFEGISTPMPLEQDHYRRILKWEQAQTRRLGRHRLQRYYQNRRYFYGENEEPDNVQQPLGIRYVPVVHQKHVHYLFGEWEEDIVNWQVEAWEADKEEEYELSQKIQRTIFKLMRRSNANQIFYKAAMDGSIYGDSVFKVSWDSYQKRARIESILPEFYHAVWHPLDPNQTLEAVVAFNMDRATAQSIYKSPGTQGFLPTGSGLNPQMATVWEWWSPYEMQVCVDSDMVLKSDNIYMSGSAEDVQPGMLPFVHIANLAINGEYWGFGDAEPAFKLADELNFRLADIGDIINYHAHPITLLRNFFGKVDALPVAADAVWDLGRDGEAEYLEWGGPPPAMLEYIDMLLRVLLETTNLTPVAFGIVEQSQASSAALNIQMLPVTEIVRRKRAVWGPALRDLAIKLLTLEEVVIGTSKFKKLYGFGVKDLERFDIRPKWSPILPRDRLQMVNEQVGLLSNKARSILQSLMEMNVDDPQIERDRIMADLKEFAEIEAEVNMMIASHEAKLNEKLVRIEADANKEAIELEMAKTKLEHKTKMEQDPTTDPERHARHIETVKTEHAEERKTLDAKAKHAHSVAAARVKAAKVTIQRGGKNSTKAKGGSNTDGGS